MLGLQKMHFARIYSHHVAQYDSIALDKKPFDLSNQRWDFYVLCMYQT